MPEGIFRLKETAGGWRHYIELPNGDHDDINCGSALEVQLGHWEEVRGGEKLVPDRWLAGRYEANLCRQSRDHMEAYLYLGHCYPGCDELVCAVPLGARVRRPESDRP